MSGAVARMVEDLRTRGGLKLSDLANITHVSQTTVSRWTAGKAAPHPRTQLVISDLCYVVDRLAEFYSPEENGSFAALRRHRQPVTVRCEDGALCKPRLFRHAGDCGSGILSRI
jgi:transcriptional regulator with XRE-family HTH domain